MSFRLRNQNNPSRTLSLNNLAWYSVLDTAEEYGWNPMGTAQPGAWLSGDLDLDGYFLQPRRAWGYNGNGSGGGRGQTRQAVVRRGAQSSLVLIEDALNLADALDRAFMGYEPEFLPAYTEVTLAGFLRPAGWLSPGIGVILELADFCRDGAFTIERC